MRGSGYVSEVHKETLIVDLEREWPLMQATAADMSAAQRPELYIFPTSAAGVQAAMDAHAATAARKNASSRRESTGVARDPDAWARYAGEAVLSRGMVVVEVTAPNGATTAPFLNAMDRSLMDYLHSESKDEER